MSAALKVINDSLQKSLGAASNLKNANKIVQKEWFQMSSTDSANPLDVEDYLDCFEEYSSDLLRYMVNLIDANVSDFCHVIDKIFKNIFFFFLNIGQHRNALCSFTW